MKFSIIPILKKHGVIYKQIGDELCFRCPICHRQDHFYYNKVKNLCLCQRCKCEFNAVGFLLSIGYSKKDATSIVFGRPPTSREGVKAKVDKLLQNENSYEDIEMRSVYFKNPLPEGCIDVSEKKYPKALMERGTPPNVAKDLCVKYCNSSGLYFNRLVFPVSTLKSETFTALTAFPKKKYERIKKEHKRRGINFRKSLFPKGSFMSEMLYLYNNVKDKTGRLFVVEGIWDVLRLMSYRLTATCSFGDKISRKQALLLSRTNAKEIWLMLDGNVPYKRLLRYYDLLNTVCFDKKIFLCTLPEYADPDNVLEKDLIETLKEAKRRVIPCGY